jgi:hypothetical protein
MLLRDRMERRAVEALAGRRAELERLEAFALGDEPLVMHIHGIPGIGKTHLLNALAPSLGAKGIVVVRIDARWCEPSPAAFCRAISKEIGVPESEDAAVVAGSLPNEGGRTLPQLRSLPVSSLVILAFIRSHVAAAGVLFVGTRHTALVGLQRIT